MGNDEEAVYFSEGVTEEIINALTKIPELRVTSRTSSFFYKDKNFPITQIAEGLGVSLILEGSVRFSSDRVRISAQLIDAHEDINIWSNVWDRELEDIFAVQDEISLLIAEKSREVLGHFDLQERLVNPQTRNFQAYELFLNGRFHFRQWKVEDVRRAADLFDQALALDPNHVESMMGKADALGFLATTGFVAHAEAWRQVELLIDKALLINPKLANAYYQRSQLKFFFYCDFKGAMEDCYQAIQLHPNHPEANQQLSFLHILAGEREKSKQFLDHSLQVDPLSQEVKFFDAYYDYMVENYATALLKLQELLALNPYNIPAQSVACYCYLKQGKLDEAYHFFDKYEEGTIVEEDKLGIQTLAAIMKGDDDNSKELVEEVERKAKTPEGFRSDSFLLFIYSIQGNREKFYDWIEKARSNKSSLLLIHLNDPLIERFKEEDRYQTIFKELYSHSMNGSVLSDKKPPMTPSEIEAYRGILLKLFEEDKLFTDPELSIRSLSSRMDLHPNKLSWLINESFETNFNSLINSFRVKEFQSKVKKGEHRQFSIIGLAYECGFNSKTVFNTYFKKQTGLTPKQFIDMA